MTIHIFGDSHAMYNFKNIKYIDVINHWRASITMHRVGRDGMEFINFKLKDIKNGDIVIYQFGEVDCRCNIGKQKLLGREIGEIISKLIENYFISIKNNVNNYDKINIIICCIPPTMNQEYYESIHGPITHEFPFVGNDEERIMYTQITNMALKLMCEKYNFIFLDYYNYYEGKNGLLKIDYSDNICHIIKNEYILNNLYKIIDNL